MGESIRNIWHAAVVDWHVYFIAGFLLLIFLRRLTAKRQARYFDLKFSKAAWAQTVFFTAVFAVVWLGLNRQVNYDYTSGKTLGFIAARIALYGATMLLLFATTDGIDKARNR